MIGTSLAAGALVEPPVVAVPPAPVVPPLVVLPPEEPPVEVPPLALLASDAGCVPLLTQARVPATKNVAKQKANGDDGCRTRDPPRIIVQARKLVRGTISDRFREKP